MIKEKQERDVNYPHSVCKLKEKKQICIKRVRLNLFARRRDYLSFGRRVWKPEKD